MIYEDLKEGRLVEIMPEYRSVELGIYAVYPTRKQLPLKVRRLVDLLVQEFQSPIWETPRKGRASRTASR
jgi:DNA-binding transcriptional LysR family regulator